MKELKLVNASSKNKSKQVEEAATVQAIPAVAQSPPPVPYQPKFEEVSLYMSEDDVRNIETIVDSYWKAYRYYNWLFPSEKWKFTLV